MRSHIFLFGSLPRRRPPEFTAILMFEFWREATATSVPGLLCQSGRRRPENVSILSYFVAVVDHNRDGKYKVKKVQTLESISREQDVISSLVTYCISHALPSHWRMGRIFRSKAT